MMISLIREENGTLFLRTMSVDNLIKRIRGPYVPPALPLLRKEVLRLSPEDAPYHSRRLPRMWVAGCFRKNEGGCLLKTYHGIAGVSVDAPSGETEIAHIRRRLSMLPQVLALFTGSSGRSVKVLIRFCLPDHTLPRTEAAIGTFHAHACRWATSFIQGQLPEYQVWAPPPRPDYGYRLSHDPEVVYHPDATPIRMQQPLEMPDPEQAPTLPPPPRSPLQRKMPGYTEKEIVTALFEAALNRALEEVQPYYTQHPGERNDLTPLLAPLTRYCFRSGIPEENTVTEILHHYYHRLQPGIVRQMVRNVYQTEKYFGRNPTFPKSMSLALQIDEFMQRRYFFRYNAMTGGVEYRPRTRYKLPFQPVTERVVNTIAMNALEEGLDIWDRDVKRWLNSEKVKIYKPVEEYLYTLPAWDGTERIRVLAARIPCQQQRWKDFFHRWFLSMVAHWTGIDKEHGNAVSPLLVGTQGCGKSTFCRMLLPPELRMYYTDSIDFGRRRDAELFLNRFALINIDEFDQISNAQQAFLKHLLQKPEVNIRKPHEQVVRALRRYASFIATSNHTDLLSDPSGNRRFICVEVTGRIDTQSPTNHVQLYAQALHELRQGAKYWFGPDEEKELMESNQPFELATPMEQLFLQYFVAAREGEPCEHLLAIEIQTRLQQRSKIRLSNKQITHFGRILKKMRVLSHRTKKGTYYLVREREAEMPGNQGKEALSEGPVKREVPESRAKEGWTENKIKSGQNSGHDA